MWSAVTRVARYLASALLLSGLVALAWIWFVSGRLRQDQAAMSVPVVAAIAVVTIGVLLAVKGRGRRLARASAFTLIAAAVTTAALVRVKGLTGDLFPILEYRYGASAEEPLPALPGIASAQAPVVEPVPPATVPAIEGPDAPPPAVGGDAAAAATPTATPADAVRATLTGSFPQFLGQSRSGVIPGVRLARDWSARPPKQIWRIAVGAGWSGFAVDRGLAITQEQRGGDEMVVAYDLLTGTPRWSHKDPARYESMVAGVGPRATPAISWPYVAAAGTTGLLNVLDAATGRRVWGTDIGLDNDGPSPEWGRAGSPLVLDGRVIVNAGGPNGRSLVAYDLQSGARVWSGGSDQAAYSSPTVFTLLGRRQIVILNRGSLAGHDAGSGTLLWSQPWPAEMPNVAMPIRVADDLVLASTGYGIGSKLVRLTPGPDGAIFPSFVWETPRLKAKFTNPVLYDGFVYGLDDGVLVCLDVTTGERRWRGGRYGHGQTLLVGDVLLVATEDGEIVLVEPTPDAHRERTRFRTFDAKTWNPPAIAGHYLLVRTDTEAALYELPTDDAPQ